MSRLIETVRQSRLGRCWKCMTFSVVMLVLTAIGAYVSIRLFALENSGFLGSTTFAVAVIVALCASALLTVAHFVCFVLRRTVWTEGTGPDPFAADRLRPVPPVGRRDRRRQQGRGEPGRPYQCVDQTSGKSPGRS